jgi:hypothetical protein
MVFVGWDNEMCTGSLYVMQEKSLMAAAFSRGSQNGNLAEQYCELGKDTSGPFGFLARFFDI